MEQVVGADAEGKLIAILRILSESSEPLGSITIARRLEGEGVFLSERAVRYHRQVSPADSRRARLHPAWGPGWADDYCRGAA